MQTVLRCLTALVLLGMGGMMAEASGSMKLHCVVEGDASLVSSGFAHRLCSDVANGINAKLVRGHEFRRALATRRGGVVLARLRVSVLRRDQLEYVFSVGEVEEWGKRREKTFGVVRISIVDSRSLDPAIQQIVHDVKRFVRAM